MVGTHNVVGCTTDGEMPCDGHHKGSAVLGDIATDQIDFSVVSAENLGQNSDLAGKRLASKLPPTVQYLQLFSDGISGNGCVILRGISSILGENIPIAGGTAAIMENFSALGSLREGKC